MANLQSLIKQHNAKFLTDGKKPTRFHNCRYKDGCHLAGKYLAKCISYKAEVINIDKRKLYYGTSDGEFKFRFNNHTRSFRHKMYSIDTELSNYIWKLSNDKIQYEIKWNIAAYASSYKCRSRRCDLDYVHTLRIGFVPKYLWFVMTCPLNLRNVPEWSVHMWSKRDSLSSPETCNMASTVEKTNINNVKNNENNQELLQEKFIFPASLFRFMLYTLCKNLSLVEITIGNTDILTISETNLDESFSKGQFLIKGFSEPYRL